MKKFKTRILLIVCVLMATLFFSSDFSLIDIQKTAIIVSIGIDKEKDEFLVSAQIAIPQASDTTSANNDAIVNAKGKTVFEAIDNIGIRTGWQPKLSFCDLILIGQDAKDDIIPITEYLLASKKVQNSALIALCEKTANEVLTAKTPLDAISSFAIQKILLKNTLKVNTVCDIDLRNFAMLHYSPSNTAYMPIIAIEQSDSKGKDEGQESGSSSQMASSTQGSQENGGGSSGSGSGSSSGSGSGSSSNEKVVFNTTKTAIFSSGKLKAELNDDETLMFNLLYRKVDESFIPIEYKGEQYLLSINKNTKKISVSFEEKPTLNIELNLLTAISDSTKKGSTEDMLKINVVGEELLNACKQKVESILDNLITKLKENDCDLFQAKNHIYKKHNNLFSSLKDFPFSSYNHKISVTIKSLDK